MTGLEALKEIFNIIYNLDCGTTFEQDKKLNECRDVLKRVIFNAEKSLKALEIIKKKRANVGTFIHLTKILKKDYEQCKALNNTFGANICEKEALTEEEFNLLKEVLE